MWQDDISTDINWSKFPSCINEHLDWIYLGFMLDFAGAYLCRAKGFVNYIVYNIKKAYLTFLINKRINILENSNTWMTNNLGVD